MGVKFDLILAVRSQFFKFMRETLYIHALKHLEAAGPGKKSHFFSSYSKRLSIFDLFEGLIGRDTFLALAPVLGPQQKKWL